MKKLNQKGFTIVELLTSFMLATVVLIFLFNILLSIKEGYLGHKENTDMATDQSFISRIINEDAHNYVLTSAPTSSNDTITLNVECISNNCGSERQIVYTFSNHTFQKKISNVVRDSYELEEEFSIFTTVDTNLKTYGSLKYYKFDVSLKGTSNNSSKVIIYFPSK